MQQIKYHQQCSFLSHLKYEFLIILLHSFSSFRLKKKRERENLYMELNRLLEKTIRHRTILSEDSWHFTMCASVCTLHTNDKARKKTHLFSSSRSARILSSSPLSSLSKEIKIWAGLRGWLRGESWFKLWQ